MSKLFNDPEYKRMLTDDESWLELAIEPFRFYLNDMIPLLPERIELNFDDILYYYQDSTDDRWMDLNIVTVLSPFFNKNIDRKMSRKEQLILAKLFTIDIKDGTEINFVNKTINNPIVISRIANEIPEDEIKNIINELCVNEIHITEYRSGSQKRNESLSRMNEILDLIGTEKASDRSTRSVKRKANALRHRISAIVANDEWRIRDYKIIEAFCENVQNYINYGTLHSLMNITRLKCMTHKGAPIYSMEEIK